MDIPTKYNPKDREDTWYKFWEEKGYFHAEVNPKKKPYTVVIPPPNVTGILHMGHALNNTIQDIYIRFKRMQGHVALWMPGTDHAGIATQNVVEKMLMEKGINRQDLGREKFLEEVWKWREEYGATIINQLKKLGCSCDWERTRFTMDEVFSDAVLEAFIRLYNKGLIYRGDYIINWCPRCQTALSDEEAQHRDIDGTLYYIKYPIVETPSLRGGQRRFLARHCERVPKGRPKQSLAGSEQAPQSKEIASVAPSELPRNDSNYVVVATTRPETMLGDVAVCVNPKDKRYKDLRGKTAILPILNRPLKVIFDPIVDPSFGTGVLKVTPAHDPVDFELGLRHKLEPINVMNEDASMNELAGDYKDMDRLECREAIIDDLKERGLFIKSEPYRHTVGHCYRCHTMVEPRLSKQWFVRMKPLSRQAKKAVEKGKIKFYPRRWTKVYLNWMANIKDWCISRQIWWGHRIPVYYCKRCSAGTGLSACSIVSGRDLSPHEPGIIVAKTKPDECPKCKSTEIEQDPDVLDTWFSSWLWPFATFGWPFNKNPAPLSGAGRGQKSETELKYFYPTDVLVTAQEIIFFWVARMIMSGLEFMKDIPFRDIYIHGTVRDQTGTKMSKSLGNIIDPIDIINQFGSDALRFSIISITAQGQDVFLSPQKFEVGRNFANKLWNASRFVLMNLKEDAAKKDLCQIASRPDLALADRWILSRFYQALGDFGKSLESYRINDAAQRIYEFIWHEFCDWYLEIAKLTIDEPHTQITLYKILEKSLRMLHPIMPFITEDIWQRLPREHGTDSIMITSWPHIQKEFISKKVDSQMALFVNIVQAIRNLRATWGIEHGKRVDVFIKAMMRDSSVLKANAAYINKLALVENLKISTRIKKPRHSALGVLPDIEIFLPLEGVIDINKEKRRLEEKLVGLSSEVDRTEAKLKNKEFISKAPRDVIQMAEEKRESLKREIILLNRNLKSL